MTSSKPLTFKVIRKTPELISPAKPTPHEIKFLSDIDDQDGLRLLIPLIYFFKNMTSMEGKDPVTIIRDALAKALVFYYPLAGRLREYPDRKLVVECTGEGVVFVEADADVMLHQFGDALYPPFPNLEGLLLDMPTPPGSHGIINCPLLVIQVTRLRCGGFIVAYLANHTISDGAGIFQFLSAVGELARGGAVPSIQPVWERHILISARHPRNVSEYDATITNQTPPIFNLDKMAQRSFLFDASNIFALRRSLPPHLQSCSKFDVVAACVWRCWTIALAKSTSRRPDDESRFMCVVDIRKKMKPPLPVGYYGNAIVFPAAVATVENLSEKPLHYAVEIVRKAKYEATNDYVAAVLDMLAVRDKPRFAPAAMTYVVSDLTHAGLEKVDFGWGAAAYGGVAKGVADWIPTHVNWYVPFKNKMGEDGGIIVPVCLPFDAMEEFVKHLEKTIITAQTSFNLSPL